RVARLAHQVVVALRALGQLIGAAPIAQMADTHQADALQQLQRAVDAGDVEARDGVLDLRTDVLGRYVAAAPPQYVPHELALRRQPVTQRLKLVRRAVLGHVECEDNVWSVTRGPRRVYRGGVI